MSVSERRYYNTGHSNVKLTAKAERIPHSRNADWRSDLCTQKREKQVKYTPSLVPREGRGRETAWYKDAHVVERR